MASVSFSYETFIFPAWAAEELRPERLITGGRLVASAFPYLDQVTLQLSAAALADATSISVDAVAMANPLSVKANPVIPVGANLYFGESKEFAKVTTAVNLAATSVAVQALPSALEDNDTATYEGLVMRKPVTSGILVGRTYVERAANTGFGLPDVSTPDDELFLTAFGIEDALINPDVVLVRHRTKIYEDLLPGWSSLDSTTKAAIRSRYDCVLSAR